MAEIETSRSPRRGALAALAFALIGATAAACGDDGNSSNPAPDAPTDASEPTNSAVLVAERVFTPDARLYYVSVLPDVPTAAIDRTKALELTSADIEIYNKKVFIRDRDAATMTRYSVAADLTLVKEGQVSFANYGLDTANRHSSVYVSPTRAYLTDSIGWRMIGWNPSTMTLTNEVISLAGMSHPEFTTATGQISAAVQVGDRFLAAVYWEDLQKFIIYPGSGLLVIDPTQAAPTMIEDARLGGAFRVAADGNDAYLIGVTDGAARLTHGVFNGGTMPESGVLKLAAGASSFDPAYQVDIEAITRTITTWAIFRLTRTKLLVQIFDPAAPIPTNAMDYATSTNFIFGLIDTEAKTFTASPDMPRGGRANAGNYLVDGKQYVQVSDSAGNGMTYAVTSDGAATPAFPVPSGDVWQLQRLR